MVSSIILGRFFSAVQGINNGTVVTFSEQVILHKVVGSNTEKFNISTISAGIYLATNIGCEWSFDFHF